MAKTVEELRAERQCEDAKRIRNLVGWPRLGMLPVKKTGPVPTVGVIFGSDPTTVVIVNMFDLWCMTAHDIAELPDERFQTVDELVKVWQID